MMFKSQTLTRSSNIELLRLIAMLMVLIVHANGLANGFPNVNEIKLFPLNSISRVLTQSYSIVAVNIFVLISGWFGIKLTVKGIMNIVYQCAFFSLLAIIICGLINHESITPIALYKEIFGFDGYWFVSAYLGLMILSPVLNSFTESSSQNNQLKVLTLFFLFQTYFLLDVYDDAHFHNGYSCISFVGLYLLARYVRKFRPKFSSLTPIKDMAIYIIACGSMGGVIILTSLTSSDSLLNIVRSIMLSYNNPVSIIAALFLLLAFTKVNIGVNKIINWMAKSSFSIYLVHVNLLVLPYYKTYMQHLYVEYDGIKYLVAILLSISAISICSILIDQLRISSWNIICKLKMNSK